MNTEKFISENFPQDKAQQFADILKYSISNYIEKNDNCTIEEWLNSYLTEYLPNKSTEEISTISNEIISTIQIHDKTMDSMYNAMNSGKSVEAWFQEEISSQQPVGQQAYELTEAHSALTSISNQYVDSDEQQEIVNVEVIDSEEWNDEMWNKYKMKDLVTETVRQAGDTALRTTASDLYEKTMEYGLKTVLTDKDLISESIINGASSGLKIATAGAMEIANENNVFPVDGSDTESRALIAGVAIENVKTLGRVASGEIGIADGLKEMQNISVATVAAIIKSKTINIGSKIGKKIGTTIGAVFGPIGAAVGHFAGGVVGKMAGTKVGSKIIETAKRVGSAAKSVVSRVANGARNIFNKVKSFFRGW